MPIHRLTERISSVYQPNQYPVCFDQAQRWKKDLPLAGLTILDATPVFENTLAKYIGLLSAGAKLLVGINNVMPRDPEVVDFLCATGITVVSPEDDFESPDIILDCAATFVHHTPNIGFCELTRSGVDKYCHHSCPIYVADSGRIKKIETTLGTGESYFRAMRQLGYNHFKDKKIVIFGSGKVGSGLIMYAHRYGCAVTVVTRPSDITSDIRALCQQVIAADDREAIGKALQTADLVVTATGVANALMSSCTPQMWTGCHAIIANMGVEDEFGPHLPANRVLEQKRPLNFILHEPTLMPYIDATMALHNEGAIYLAQHPTISGLISPAPSLEESLLHIARINGTLGQELDCI